MVSRQFILVRCVFKALPTKLELISIGNYLRQLVFSRRILALRNDPNDHNYLDHQNHPNHLNYLNHIHVEILGTCFLTLQFWFTAQVAQFLGWVRQPA